MTQISPPTSTQISPQVSPLYDRFARAARAAPDKVALLTGGRGHTYAELLRDSAALAAGLQAGGVRAGDHVGVLLPNCAQFVLLLLAAARCGAVLVPQSIGLSEAAVDATFRASGVRHLVAWHGAPAALTVAAGLEGGALRVCVGGPVGGWTAFDDLLAQAASPDPLAIEAAGSDAALPYLMVLTSGSTGAPKPIVLSQRTKLLRAQCAVELYGVRPDDVTLAATPLYHSLAQRLVLVPLLTGGTSVLMEHFTPAGWLEAVRAHKVSFSIAVSSQLKQLLAGFAPGQAPLESLRCLVSSSALLDDATKAALFERVRCEFHECYGTSEVAIATNLSPEDARRSLGSVGRAVPGAEVAILDAAGRSLPAGEQGEIAVRTKFLHSGYYGRPEATAESMCGEYFRTGDLGRLDANGYLYFLGRIKDIIITGGVNVYPKDIEDVVGSHPAVKECAAIPVADERLGEVVGVVLAPNDPQAPPALRDLQRLCMQRLGDFQQPRVYHVVEALPRNPMGKLDKPALKQRYSNPGGQA